MTGLVQVWGMAHELEIGHVVARVWISQVGGWLDEAWARGSRAETRDLYDKKKGWAYLTLFAIKA